jgi:hypothetical protein
MRACTDIAPRCAQVAPMEHTGLGRLHGRGIEEMEPGALATALVTETNGSVRGRGPG